MTLIAAWPCQGGIVLHADSQETVGDYRATVQKIEPTTIGGLQVAVAGSGAGDLVDTFIECLRRELRQDTPQTIGEFLEVAERELGEFYRIDVHSSPMQPEDKRLKMVIGAAFPSTREYGAWVTTNIRLLPVEKVVLAGWEEQLYKHLAERLYSRDMSIAQGVLAGIYVLSVAEATSNYVRGPMSTAVIRDNGIWMEDQEYIRDMAKRLHDYEENLNEIFLSCADTSIPVHELQESLFQFVTVASDLHRQHIDSQVQSLTFEKMAAANDPYPKYPTDSYVTLYTNGRAVIEHDPEKVRQHLERTKRMSEELRDHEMTGEQLVVRVSADRYYLVRTNRFENGAPQPMGEKSLSELTAYLGDRKFMGINEPADVLNFLNVDGKRLYLYELKSRQSVSQTSEPGP